MRTADPLGLLIDLLQARGNRVPAKQVRTQWPEALAYLEQIGVVQADALLTELTCSECDRDHSVVTEFDPVARKYRYFCPEAGLVIVEDDDLASLRVDFLWLLDWLERELPVVPPRRRRPLIEGRVWLLGEALIDKTSLMVVLVIGQLAPGDQHTLTSALARVRPTELGILLTTCPSHSPEPLVVQRYDLLYLREIARAATDCIVLDRERFGARVRQLRDLAAERTHGNAGRPSTALQTSKIFDERRARGIPYINKSTEAREILAEWPSSISNKPPAFSTVRGHLPNTECIGSR
jgi:hypothetical protein